MPDQPLVPDPLRRRAQVRGELGDTAGRESRPGPVQGIDEPWIRRRPGRGMRQSRRGGCARTVLPHRSPVRGRGLRVDRGR